VDFPSIWSKQALQKCSDGFRHVFLPGLLDVFRPEQLLNYGQTVADVCRALEVSAATYHRWQQLYEGM
jgi:hypothetical protein